MPRRTKQAMIRCVPRLLARCGPTWRMCSLPRFVSAVNPGSTSGRSTVLCSREIERRRGPGNLTGNPETRNSERAKERAMNVSVTPGFAAFRLAYEAGRGSLMWRKGVADLETPVAAFLKLAHGQPNS